MRYPSIGRNHPTRKGPIRGIAVLDFTGQIPDGHTIETVIYAPLQNTPIVHQGRYVGIILTEPVPTAPMRADAYVELILTVEEAAVAFPHGFILDPRP